MKRTPLLSKLLFFFATAAFLWAPGPARGGSQTSKPLSGKTGNTSLNQGQGNPIKVVPANLAQPPVTANLGTGVTVPGGNLEVIPAEGLKAPLAAPNAAASVVPQLTPILETGSGPGTGVTQSQAGSRGGPAQVTFSNAPGTEGTGKAPSPGLKATEGLSESVEEVKRALDKDKVGAAREEADNAFSGGTGKKEGSQAVATGDDQASRQGGGSKYLPEVSEELPGQKGLSKARDPPYVEDKKALFTTALSLFGIAQPAPKALEALASLTRKVARLNRENTETDQYHGFSHQVGPASVANLFLKTLQANNSRGEKVSGLLDGIEMPAGMTDQEFKGLVGQAILFTAMAAVAHDAEGVEVVFSKNDGGRSYIPIQSDPDPSKPEGKISVGKLVGVKPVAKLYEDGQGASFLYPKVPDTRSYLGNALELIEGRGPDLPGYLKEANSAFGKYVMLLATMFADEEKALFERNKKRLLGEMQVAYGERFEFMLALAERLAARLGGADLLQAYAQPRGALLRNFKLQREFRDPKKVTINGTIAFLDKFMARNPVYQELYGRMARTFAEDQHHSREGTLRSALYMRILAEKGLVPKNLNELMELYGEERLGKALEPRLTALEAALDRDPAVRALLEKTRKWLDLPLDKAMDKIMGRVEEKEKPLKDFIDLNGLKDDALRDAKGQPVAITEKSLLGAMGVAR